MLWHVTHNRRTHGVFHTEEEAMDHHSFMVRLMNGTPFGFRYAIMKRLGAHILISYSEFLKNESE